MATNIQPHSPKSWDIFRANDYIYYIRHDLKPYNSVFLKHKTKTDQVEIGDVGFAFSKGEHYMNHYSSSKNTYFKVCIKGTKWIKVKDIVTGEGYEENELHDDFKNGDHYFQSDDKFYIIKGTTYWWGSDLSKKIDKDNTGILNKSIKDPLCFWGESGYCYILMDDPAAGIVYNRIKGKPSNNFDTKEQWSVPDSFVSFMPGGLSKVFGVPVLEWKEQDSFDNSKGKLPKEVSFSFDFMAGNPEHSPLYQQPGFSKDWNIEMTINNKPLSIEQLIFRTQISMDPKYGGLQIESESLEWLDNKVAGTREKLIAPAGKVLKLFSLDVILPNLAKQHRKEMEKNMPEATKKLLPGSMKSENMPDFLSKLKGQKLLLANGTDDKVTPDMTEELKETYFTHEYTPGQVWYKQWYKHDPPLTTDLVLLSGDALLAVMNVGFPYLFYKEGLDPWEKVCKGAFNIFVASTSYKISNMRGLGSIEFTNISNLKITKEEFEVYSIPVKKVEGTCLTAAKLNETLIAHVSGTVYHFMLGEHKLTADAYAYQGNGKCEVTFTGVSADGFKFGELQIEDLKLNADSIDIKNIEIWRVVLGVNVPLGFIPDGLRLHINGTFTDAIVSVLTPLVQKALNNYLKTLL